MSIFDKSKLKQTPKKEENKPLIMVVDDEVQNINVLRDLLEEKYQIITSLNGQEALELIHSMESPDKIQLIISDQRMPKMTGVEFFERIIDKIPETIRIILTGYTDIQAIIDSINKANIYKFITKPFEPAELLLTVQRGIEAHQMKRQLQEGDRLKREFISTISHELRTPMNGIQGALELIKMDTEQGSYKENLSTIETSTNHMLGLIDSILDFTLFESGTNEIQLKKAHFTTEVDALIEGFRERCQEKGLQLNYEPLDSDTCLEIDIDKTRQVITYLLSNAIKFTATGSISVTANVASGLNGKRLNIKITDTGIGIDKDFHKEMFSLFKQADGSFSRQYGGLGIGLTLAKRLLTILKGDISIESAPGKGSSFSVKIPVNVCHDAHRVKPKPVPVNNEETSSEEKASTTILVVEDNVVNQQVLRCILEKLGYNVETCINGEQAVSWCEKQKADLIFMDCQMPIMDGIEATRKIRSSSDLNSNQPIIAVTANVSAKDRETCFHVGMTDFITKPIKKDIIQKALKQWIAQT